MYRDDRLDPRKKDILQAIIEDYIKTAEPIGSRTIAKNHALGLSSATIRNEMADLEEMGYLIQPHTSAGRVPSQRGYRLYVDELVKSYELTKLETKKMKDLLDIKINDIDELIKAASTLISEITDYISIGVTPKIKNSIIKTVYTLPTDVGQGIVVLILDNGTVRNSFIPIDSKITVDELMVISNALSSVMSGKKLEEFDLDDIKKLGNKLGISEESFSPYVKGVFDCINSVDSTVFMEGAINIFNQPEFQDVIRAKDFLKAMQEKDRVLEIMSDSIATSGIFVRIGKENLFDELQDCSLITATYSIDDVVIGSIGIVGPTRMKYGKVLTSIECASKNLNKQFKRLSNE